MSSINIILIIIGIVLFFRFKNKKYFKKREMPIRSKQLLFLGKKINTPLTPETPLVCLMTDGNIYGDYFKFKEVPHLPHNENCKCFLTNFAKRSSEWFEKKNELDIFKSDLGDLEENEARYYKTALILKNPDLALEERAVFQEMLGKIKVEDLFKEKVNNHLYSLLKS